MSSSTDGVAGVSASAASPSEKDARLTTTSAAHASGSTPKLRSCVVCRRRKVRCDKANPCSNCRRGNIACVFPSNDRPPRWARRLERLTNDAAANPSPSLSSGTAATAAPQAHPVQPQQHVMERLRTLEGLVRELSSQLEQASAVASAPASSGNSPGSTTGSHGQDAGGGELPSIAGTAGLQKQFGRMVLKDANRSRYISSGFWSRVDLHGLKMDLAGNDSDSSDDDQPQGLTPSTQELDRTPSERHGFLFGHNLGPSRVDSREFHPLPSQIPFLLNTYSENVNLFTQAVHMPTLTKVVRDLRGTDASNLAPADEALLFAVYYAAVTSMEEDDVINNFGTTKGELNLKFRLGLEHALARADFLNVPDLIVLQAFTVFLALARRHDSPRFVWMMVGLAIRIAQALGLHRDGSHFKHLSPYEVEMRRRVWWTICMVYVRASEDQGTDYTIAAESFDTKFPLNINDADISPETKETPTPREGMTDMTFPIDIFKVCDVTRRMMALGGRQGAPSLDDQRRLLDELAATVESNYFEYAAAKAQISLWVGTTCIHLVVSKMSLMIYFPTLFASPSEQSSTEIRNKLLVDALQIAEWNHALNAAPSARQWRWMYQTYTHWHAVVFLLIEVAHRPLSPLVERAWLALHSVWLIPARPDVDFKKLQIWVPLRKLMAKARRHRAEEIERLKGDARAAEMLEVEDGKMPSPASSCPFYSEEGLREHWRGLLRGEASAGNTTSAQTRTTTTTQSSSSGASLKTGTTLDDRALEETAAQQHYLGANNNSMYGPPQSLSQFNVEAVYQNSNPSPGIDGMHQNTGPASGEALPPSVFQNSAQAWAGSPFLWADADPVADVFGDVDVQMDIDSLGESYWFNWARNMESTGNQGGFQ
ncbi:hypothetical protein M406DRAFT_295286 [Cryphonectria parasitica EP155]|uniref:Zn(2)-C6 fungal-type domain-containing protein n=1 Tax=Cryphonectria parasitica (strain ATCC 38755 / EP155) TaxID=660469 RepID=A0A9P4XW13_CRYP1|nr:uncharacterized protein M406DRAFT_295286 [Cryphonectria parasitica EP155]KAF3761610.1 hypothetical protein M406DRAFT_295286 [Cryphonectria parasitica EP155]